MFVNTGPRILVFAGDWSPDMGVFHFDSGVSRRRDRRDDRGHGEI